VYIQLYIIQASEKEREKALPTMKDNDFLSDKLKISIGEEAKEKLLETLAADVEFLTRFILVFPLSVMRSVGVLT
jgi:1-phosphatidylinositol-5-phosphate 4-kinase